MSRLPTVSAVPEFWQYLDQMVASSEVVLDRPAGTPHPRYPEFIYPFDYGYLAGTSAPDGDPIDLWLGSLPERSVSGIICNIDLLKRGSEIKLLLGCTAGEAEAILAVHNVGSQAAILITRPQRT